MTWVKICGTTNLEDAQASVRAGADALGFVFHEKSPRHVDPETTRDIISKLPPAIEKVGVFVNQDAAAICDAADRATLTAVQLHGEHEDARVAHLILERRPNLKILPAISMHRHAAPESWAMMWDPASVFAFLVDSGSASSPGGTGQAFDWNAHRDTVEVVQRLGRVVLAGGLNPQNVDLALRTLHPWGVDVVSGVEVGPGRKDHAKLRAFVNAVRSAAP